MNRLKHSSQYQHLAKELHDMIGYDIANQLQHLEISPLVRLRASLISMEVYMLSDKYQERISHG